MAPVFDFLYRFARVFHSDFRNRNFPPPPLTRLSDTPYIRSEYSFRPVFCEDIFLFSGEDGKNRLYTHGNFCVTESSESLREKDRLSQGCVSFVFRSMILPVADPAYGDPLLPQCAHFGVYFVYEHILF